MHDVSGSIPTLTLHQLAEHLQEVSRCTVKLLHNQQWDRCWLVEFVMQHTAWPLHKLAQQLQEVSSTQSINSGMDGSLRGAALTLPQLTEHLQGNE
jgi:hypothetical protein